MSELALGQREVSLEESFDFEMGERDLVLTTAKGLLVDILKVTGGKMTLNALLGELSQNASKGLELSAKPGDLNAAPQSGEVGSESVKE